MTSRSILLAAVGIAPLGLPAAWAAGEAPEAPDTSPPRPNIIVILTDDQGYSDLGCYGARGFRTPHADSMAARGMMFTDFYMASALSTPSRAGLLTGCYPVRVDMAGVLFPDAKRGLAAGERTIAAVLREAGYSTACVGKWHLGHHLPSMPLAHGFDEFFGLPYSNDMIPLVYPGQHVPNNSDRAEFPDLPLYLGDEVIETNPLQSELTTRYTEFAVSFIERGGDGPFFLYLAHSMPHVPLAVSEKFRGKSHKGLYGDVMMEVDWSVGEIRRALVERGIAENTLVVYTSDNGPWLQMGDHGGCAEPLSLGKGNTFEGGQRVFCLMEWPEVIPPGSVCREPASAIDLLPTFAAAAGAALPENVIDGLDITSLLTGGPAAVSPHEALYFYGGEAPNAIRCGDWKFHLRHPYWKTIIPGRDGFRGAAQRYVTGPALYNMREDIGEEVNLIDRYPELAADLRARLLEFDGRLKAGRRPAAVYE